VTEYVWVEVAVIASVTLTTTVDVPAAVGVPEIVPVEELIDRPAGRPVADHVYGVVPPLAVGVAGVYAVPTCPLGSADGHATVSGGAIVKLYVFVDDAVIASVTVPVTVKEPAAVGVPEIAPVVALIAKPAGRPVADHVYGVVPPLAVGVAGTYATPTSPFGRADGQTTLSVGLIVTE